ncbi:hypothetical protein V8E54_007293 [Elaphomyces granulatus]
MGGSLPGGLSRLRSLRDIFTYEELPSEDSLRSFIKDNCSPANIPTLLITLLLCMIPMTPRDKSSAIELKTGGVRHVSLPEMLPTPPDPALIDEVLTTCSARDDPRFLARIASGIVSPRVDLPEEIEDIVLPATITFGMGIDKPNIRNIVHFDMPPRYYSGVPVVI